jgi:hypothetical protein
MLGGLPSPFFSCGCRRASGAGPRNRIALLGGNQAFSTKIRTLKNPHADIALIASALRSLGFTVTEVETPVTRRSTRHQTAHQNRARRRRGLEQLHLLFGHGAADPAYRSII